MTLLLGVEVVRHESLAVAMTHGGAATYGHVGSIARKSMTLMPSRPLLQAAAWMPLIVLGARIAEPLPALRAVNSRRIIARLIVRRHSLTQSLQVLALVFLFFYRHDTPTADMLSVLVGLLD